MTTTVAAATRADWRAVTSVGLGLFTLVASEFLPASMLPRIAADLGVSEGTAGQAVTATALMGAVIAPTIAVLLPRQDRRHVLIGLMTLAVASNLLVAVTPSYWLLLVARLLLGAALAGVWAFSIAVTSRLVPADRLGRALTVVNTGSTVAAVAAMPLGAYVGEVWGWRVVFAIAAVAGGVALVAQARWLPAVPPAGSPGLRTLLRTARRPVLATGLAAIALVAVGHFAAFTYLRTALEPVPGLTAGLLAALLLLYGALNVVGNLLAGPLADRRLTVLVLGAPFLIGVSTLALAATLGTLGAVFVPVAVWAIGFGAVPTAFQTWIARTEPDRLEPATGLMIATFQLAIALGAVAGGVLVDGVGVRAALVAGGVAALLGTLVLATLRRVRA
ncbi:MFS transporter [Cryptosporangium arvum]|uniref:MFS transporter n=1 Tax=Cryptosporangium arvum TaxID=80871 RepID=UPI0004AFD578|nr:MFS transporter [Cryptosporangium arvum]